MKCAVLTYAYSAMAACGTDILRHTERAMLLCENSDGAMKDWVRVGRCSTDSAMMLRVGDRDERLWRGLLGSVNFRPRGAGGQVKCFCALLRMPAETRLRVLSSLVSFVVQLAATLGVQCD
eukprot:221387-Rhodomonas_salina.1